MGDLSDCLTWSGDKGVSAAPTGTIHFSCRSMASGLMARTTHIIKSNGETTRLDYLMRQNERSWRISDVYLDGSISQLAVHRSEFHSIFQREGFDGLVLALNRKVDLLSTVARAS